MDLIALDPGVCGPGRLLELLAGAQALGHVIAFIEDGKIVAELQDSAGTYPEATAVTETRERLYVQSLHAKVIGWLSR